MRASLARSLVSLGVHRHTKIPAAAMNYLWEEINHAFLWVPLFYFNAAAARRRRIRFLLSACGRGLVVVFFSLWFHTEFSVAARAPRTRTYIYTYTPQVCVYFLPFITARRGREAIKNALVGSHHGARRGELSLEWSALSPADA